ncbi:HAD family hydrolase [Anaerosporobacter sp.]|uniref:HAD family hydrolase n=1 Tax=Anaerosporobacter sp. TaxID=1872529 RepID=UPI00286FA3A2|nr:HAD family hydrolase [Anaerosporobacter sp.]
MKKKAAIFDLDGTIADTLESIAYSANMMLESLGLMKRPDEEYNYYAGDGADVLVMRALKAACNNEEQAKELFLQAKAKYKEVFEEYCMYNVKPFDGIVTMLNELKARGIKIGVLSNKPHDRTISVINELFGENYFDSVCGQKEGLPKKPDPSGARIMLEEFAVVAEECLYVGDTNVDMQTGKNTGMFTVGVLWGFRDREELEQNHADVIITNPSELLTYIE